MTTITRNRPTAGEVLSGGWGQAAVEELARRRLADLKQVLQTHLRNLDGVAQIDNQVDVVSATGLSSVRPR